MIIDRRQFEREDKDIQAQYVHGKDTHPCTITDASVDGLGLSVNEKLSQGTALRILFEDLDIHVKVIYVDGHDVGVKYEKAPKEVIDRLLAAKPS